jgi:hypothetical protein
LPRSSVKLAHPLGKILFQEHPRAPWLRARQLAALGAAPDFLLMHVQEGCRLLQIERTHGMSSDVTT